MQWQKYPPPLPPWAKVSHGVSCEEFEENPPCYYGIAMYDDIGGLAQDCSNSTASALELLQSCTKPSVLSAISWLFRKSYTSVMWI